MSDEPAPETFPSGIRKPTVVTPAGGPELLVLTGMSGAGRTKAAAVLADLGWYVVDNLPPQMLAELVAMVGNDQRRRLAAVVDVRGGAFFDDLEAVLDDLNQRAVQSRVYFLEASDAALVRRFEEARRPHPLQGDGTILEGIARERVALTKVRDRADSVLDTSDFSVHDLRDAIVKDIGGEAQTLQINVRSFGYKNGVPADADFVADMRFLDNPHWVEGLRPLTGADAAVRDYVLASAGASQFLDQYTALLDGVLSRYQAHDKHSVTIALGCTGGRHRSVAMARELGDRLAERGYLVRVTHRDTAVT